MEFKTKKSLKDYLQKHLHGGSLGKVTDEKLISTLTELVNYSQKEKMINFDHFKIDNDNFRSRCFYIVNSDGKSVDFSYNWVIRSYSPLSKRDRLPNYIVYLVQSARGSINYQINQWRQENDIDSTLQVDHYPTPFIKIVYDWYELQKEIEIPSFQQKNNVWRIGPTHEESFREYHLKNAQYRALDRITNSKNGTYGVKVDWYKAINKKKSGFIELPKQKLN